MSTLSNEYKKSRQAEASGAYRIPVSRAAGYLPGEAVGDNDYLASLIMPHKYPEAHLPDTSMMRNISKSINLNAQLSGRTEYLLWWRPQNTTTAILQVYYNVNAGQGTYNWQWLQTILPDQDLSQDFSLMRYVSGQINVKSSTQATGNALIGGQVYAMAFQDPLDFRNLSPNQLAPNAKDEYSHVDNYPVALGVRVLGDPTVDTSFQPPNTNAITIQGAAVDINDSFGANLDQLGGFLMALNGSSTVELIVWAAGDANLALPLPANMDGDTKFKAFLKYNGPPLPVNTAAMVLIAKYRDGSTQNVTWQISQMNQAVTMSAALSLSVPCTSFETSFEGSLSSVVPLDSLQLVMRAPGGYGTFAQFRNGCVATFSLNNTAYLIPGQQSNGAIIVVTGTDTSQQIVVNCNINLEVVPNAELSKNVKTSAPPLEMIADLETARRVWKNQRHYGLRSVYPDDVYLTMDIQGYFLKLVAREALTASASMWGDLTGGIMGLGKALLPTLGGMATNLLPPMLQPIGRGLLQSISSPYTGSSPQYGRSSSTPSRAVVHGHGQESKTHSYSPEELKVFATTGSLPYGSPRPTHKVYARASGRKPTNNMPQIGERKSYIRAKRIAGGAANTWGAGVTAEPTTFVPQPATQEAAAAVDAHSRTCDSCDQKLCTKCGLPIADDDLDNMIQLMLQTIPNLDQRMADFYGIPIEEVIKMRAMDDCDAKGQKARASARSGSYHHDLNEPPSPPPAPTYPFHGHRRPIVHRWKMLRAPRPVVIESSAELIVPTKTGEVRVTAVNYEHKDQQEGKTDSKPARSSGKELAPSISEAPTHTTKSLLKKLGLKPYPTADNVRARATVGEEPADEKEAWKRLEAADMSVCSWIKLTTKAFQMLNKEITVRSAGRKTPRVLLGRMATKESLLMDCGNYHINPFDFVGVALKKPKKPKTKTSPKAGKKAEWVDRPATEVRSDQKHVFDPVEAAQNRDKHTELRAKFKALMIKSKESFTEEELDACVFDHLPKGPQAAAPTEAKTEVKASQLVPLGKCKTIEEAIKLYLTNLKAFADSRSDMATLQNKYGLGDVAVDLFELPLPVFDEVKVGMIKRECGNHAEMSPTCLVCWGTAIPKTIETAIIRYYATGGLVDLLPKLDLAKYCEPTVHAKASGRSFIQLEPLLNAPVVPQPVPTTLDTLFSTESKEEKRITLNPITQDEAIPSWESKAFLPASRNAIARERLAAIIDPRNHPLPPQPIAVQRYPVVLGEGLSETALIFNLILSSRPISAFTGNSIANRALNYETMRSSDGKRELYLEAGHFSKTTTHQVQMAFDYAWRVNKMYLLSYERTAVDGPSIGLASLALMCGYPDLGPMSGELEVDGIHGVTVTPIGDVQLKLGAIEHRYIGKFYCNIGTDEKGVTELRSKSWLPEMYLQGDHSNFAEYPIVVVKSLGDLLANIALNYVSYNTQIKVDQKVANFKQNQPSAMQKTDARLGQLQDAIDDALNRFPGWVVPMSMQTRLNAGRIKPGEVDTLVKNLTDQIRSRAGSTKTHFVPTTSQPMEAIYLAIVHNDALKDSAESLQLTGREITAIDAMEAADDHKQAENNWETFIEENPDLAKAYAGAAMRAKNSLMALERFAKKLGSVADTLVKKKKSKKKGVSLRAYAPELIPAKKGAISGLFAPKPPPGPKPQSTRLSLPRQTEEEDEEGDVFG